MTRLKTALAAVAGGQRRAWDFAASRGGPHLRRLGSTSGRCGDRAGGPGMRLRRKRRRHLPRFTRACIQRDRAGSSPTDLRGRGRPPHDRRHAGFGRAGAALPPHLCVPRLDRPRDVCQHRWGVVVRPLQARRPGQPRRVRVDPQRVSRRHFRQLHDGQQCRLLAGEHDLRDVPGQWLQLLTGQLAPTSEPCRCGASLPVRAT